MTVSDRVKTILLLVCLSVLPIRAQVERGTISGTIHDPSGAIVASGNVVVTNISTGLSMSTVASHSGEYVAPNLIPGLYSIKVSAPGFSTLTRTGVELHVNERLVVDATLAVGEISQQVEIAEAPPCCRPNLPAWAT
jgi:hypothetical protein